MLESLQSARAVLRTATLPSRHHPPRLKKPEGGDQGPWPAKPAARPLPVEDDAPEPGEVQRAAGTRGDEGGGHEGFEEGRNWHKGESIDEPSYP